MSTCGFEIFTTLTGLWTTIRSTAVPERALALLDTSCVIDLPDRLDELAEAAALSTLTIAELAYGLHRRRPIHAVGLDLHLELGCARLASGVLDGWWSTLPG